MQARTKVRTGTDPGHKSECVETKAKIEDGQDEGGIEHPGQRVDARNALAARPRSCEIELVAALVSVV
jgi:hypothetical protein